MPDKKLTDSEIVKALECCIKDDCKNCPLGEIGGCVTMLDALDLINRLQAENKELVGNIDRLKAKCENTQIGYNFLKADFEETEKRNQDLVRAFQSYKAEAYKEFAERLKKAKQYSIERHENIVPVAVIDWILKELVGEDNAEEKE